MVQATVWLASDYQDAVQHPDKAFVDTMLAAGTVRTNRLGPPLGISGKTAVVYAVENRGRTFAVRCFTTQVTDQAQRYEALTRHLTGLWLPFLVDFAYLDPGIQVHGQARPIVRMEWIAGDQLHEYVGKHCTDAAVLGQLAAQWRGVIGGLRGLHMGHGDLQHGNILVDTQGQIKLVDYDGFYIPALHGKPPGESGHPNYQHPSRGPADFTETIDAFSALVIYLSLQALRSDPSLWSLHSGENLIFVENDLKHPGATDVWARLARNPDPHVRYLADQLQAYAKGPVAAVPDLETVLQRAPAVTRAQPTPSSAQPGTPTIATPRPPHTGTTPHQTIPPSNVASTAGRARRQTPTLTAPPITAPRPSLPPGQSRATPLAPAVKGGSSAYTASPGLGQAHGPQATVRWVSRALVASVVLLVLAIVSVVALFYIRAPAVVYRANWKRDAATWAHNSYLQARKWFNAGRDSLPGGYKWDEAAGTLEFTGSESYVAAPYDLGRLGTFTVQMRFQLVNPSSPRPGYLVFEFSGSTAYCSVNNEHLEGFVYRRRGWASSDGAGSLHDATGTNVTDLMEGASFSFIQAADAKWHTLSVTVNEPYNYGFPYLDGTGSAQPYNLLTGCFPTRVGIADKGVAARVTDFEIQVPRSCGGQAPVLPGRRPVPHKSTS